MNDRATGDDPAREGAVEEQLERARVRLRAGGTEYEAALSATANARAALEPLIVEAARAGMEPWEIEQLSHLSHQTVRNIRHSAGLPAAQRGGARRKPRRD